MTKYSHANFCFFVKTLLLLIAISELSLGSNERYENSTIYGTFRFLIFILIFNKKNNFVNQCNKYRHAISRIFSMKWLIYKIIYLLNIGMNIKNLKEP